MKLARKMLLLFLVLTLIALNVAVIFSSASARPPKWFYEQNPYGTWIQSGGTWYCFGCAPVGNCMCPH